MLQRKNRRDHSLRWAEPSIVGRKGHRTRRAGRLLVQARKFLRGYRRVEPVYVGSTSSSYRSPRYSEVVSSAISPEAALPRAVTRRQGTPASMRRRPASSGLGITAEILDSARDRLTPYRRIRISYSEPDRSLPSRPGKSSVGNAERSMHRGVSSPNRRRSMRKTGADSSMSN